MKRNRTGSQMSVKPVKKKKTKTFTGCATCRSRKIKCDLGKPFCKRCEKSGLICAGYQINLCWSRPIQFDKFGYQLPANSALREEDHYVENEKNFQRRNIDFVKYDREYETYEEMDRDLGLLHSPDYSLIEHSQTWLQGPFGVFEGLRNIPSHLMRKRRKLTKTKYRNADSPLTNGSEKTNTPPSNIRQQSNVNNSLRQVQQAQEPPTPYIERSNNLFEEQNKIHLNNEWLSNELRYDAMLSATAASFNDNLHNFDFLSPFAAASPVQIPNQPTPLNIPDIYPFDKEVFNVLRSHTALPTENFPNVPPETTTKVNNEETDLVISTSESNMPDSIMKIISTPNIPQLPPTIKVPGTGLQVGPLARYLLNHYINHVVDLMTVVAFPKNPWKTIYFPRALKALGDITGLGKSSNSRCSLLNALLAVSCFNLQSKLEKGSPEMKFFLNLGIEFRLQASSFLKKMLESNVPNLTTDKYKDVLCAILSMNTIDIVWGTMADCQYHLSICEGIIARRMKERPSLSHKAKLLHRVFSFLKLIQDSTNHENLNNMDEKLKSKVYKIFIKDCDKKLASESDFSMNGGEYFQESINNTNGKVEIEKTTSPVPSLVSNSYSPAFIDEMCISNSTSKVSKELLLTDALYGLPNSLILLFSDTVNLLKTKFYITDLDEEDVEKKGKTLRKFNEFCLGFENKLLKWENEWKLKNEETGKFLSYSHEGIYYHCMSFFNSLVIYYFTMIRDLNHILLQEYSKNCIKYLEQLQNLIKDKKVKMLPLMWQGIIGGCSAVDKSLQDRYRDWAASLSETGMGSYWGARQIMFEVWRRRENKQNNDDWFSVHKDWEMNIMLS